MGRRPASSDGQSTGSAEAVAAAPASPPGIGPPAQGSLFGAEPAAPDGIGDRDADGANIARGPGRPPGSRNRSTRQWTSFLLARYRSPLLGMAELAQASPHDLAHELGCAPADAVRIIQTAQRDLAPYLHSRQPQAVNVSGEGALVLHVDTGGGGQAAQLGAAPIEGRATDAPPVEQNQGVSGFDDGMSE